MIYFWGKKSKILEIIVDFELVALYEGITLSMVIVSVFVHVLAMSKREH